jgi:hypothetical protein
MAPTPELRERFALPGVTVTTFRYLGRRRGMSLRSDVQVSALAEFRAIITRKKQGISPIQPFSAKTRLA